jgi:hypothetical protein
MHCSAQPVSIPHDRTDVRHFVALRVRLAKGERMAIPRPSPVRLLTITLALGCLSCGVCVPRPSISGISPNSTTARGNNFLLTVDGSEFRRDAMVSWNGSFRVTSFISSHRLLAAITAADIAEPGSVLVFVFNPPENNPTRVSGAIGVNTVTVCNGKDSNAVPFTINP